MTSKCAATKSFLVSQRPSEQFSSRPRGHLVDPVKRLRNLEAGEMALAAQELADFLRPRRRAAGDQIGLDALSRQCIGLADHGALRDRGMRQKRMFDLLARYLDTA